MQGRDSQIGDGQGDDGPTGGEGASAAIRLSDLLGRSLVFFGGIAIVMMMLHIVGDVASKYLFNDPFDGTTEYVAAYYMVAAVFLPLAYVTATQGHLIVELFTGNLSAARRRLLDALAGILTAFYLAFLVYHTGMEAIRRTREGEAWETSVDLVAVWPSRWLLPIGLAAMGLVVLLQVVRLIRQAGGAGGPEMPGHSGDPS